MVFVAVFCFLTPVFAAELNVGFSEDALNSYVQAKTNDYIDVCNFDTTDTYYISQGIHISNSVAPFNYIFFIFDDCNNIGYLNVFYHEGAFYSSFVPNGISLVEEAYENNWLIYALANNESCYLLVNNEFLRISGPVNDSINNINDVSMEITSVSGEIVELTQIPVSGISVADSTVTLRKQLNVPIVSNSLSPDTGEGLCWAAAVAAIGVYKTNSSINTALEVYNWADENVSVLFYEHPVGLPNFELPVLNDCYGLSYSYHSGGPNISNAYASLVNDIPLHISMRGTREDGSLAYHAVVICGVVMGSENYYIVMDPNVTSGYVIIDIGSSNTFTYTSGSVVYTVWTRHLM